MFQLFFFPRQFFEQKLQRSVALRWVVILIVGVAALSCLNIVIVYRQFLLFVQQFITTNAAASLQEKAIWLDGLHFVGPINFVVAGLVSLFDLVYWVLITAMLAHFGVIFDRPYQFNNLLRMTGLAYAVYFPFLVVSLLLLLIFPLNLSAQGFSQLANLNSLTTIYGAAIRTTNGVFPVNVVIGLQMAAKVWCHLLFLIAYQRVVGLRWWQAIVGTALSAGLLNLGSLLLIRLS
ncbi:MAG: YIP1 family protein [Pyrinomonadaceae bacterium]